MMFKSYILTALITLWLVSLSLSVSVDKDNSCPDLSAPLLDDYDDIDSLPLSSGPVVEIELTDWSGSDLSTPLLNDYDDQDSLPSSSGPLVEIELTEIKSNEDDANLHLAQDLVQSIENLQQGLSDSNL